MTNFQTPQRRSDAVIAGNCINGPHAGRETDSRELTTRHLPVIVNCMSSLSSRLSDFRRSPFLEFAVCGLRGANSQTNSRMVLFRDAKMTQLRAANGECMTPVSCISGLRARDTVPVSRPGIPVLTSASGGISRERFKRGSRNFTHLSGQTASQTCRI